MDGNFGKKLAVALLLILFSASASAEKVQVVGSVDVNFKNLTFNPANVGKRTTPLTTINPNLIFAYKRWYGSISYDGAVGDGTISVIDGSYAQILSLSRSDLILTGGYRLGNSFSVFGGMLGGRIKGVQYGTSGTNEWKVLTINYTEQGPFIGGAYTFPVGKKSSVNLSVAYAAIQGKINQRDDRTDTSTNTLSTNYYNDSFPVSGLSYGVTLTGELTNTMSYRAGIKATSYRGEPTASLTNGIVEEYTSFFFGVTNYF